jgi:hypothetical protein
VVVERRTGTPAGYVDRYPTSVVVGAVGRGCLRHVGGASGSGRSMRRSIGARLETEFGNDYRLGGEQKANIISWTRRGAFGSAVGPDETLKKRRLKRLLA